MATTELSLENLKRHIGRRQVATAWRTREFVVKDDQGHTLYFGERRSS